MSLSLLPATTAGLTQRTRRDRLDDVMPLDRDAITCFQLGYGRADRIVGRRQGQMWAVPPRDARLPDRSCNPCNRSPPDNRYRELQPYPVRILLKTPVGQCRCCFSQFDS
jgi:hypothetical protein